MIFNSKIALVGFWISWLLAMVVGWALVQYAGIGLRNMDFSSWETTLFAASLLLTNGALIGGLLGLVYWLIFRNWITKSWRWGLATFLGYALGSPAGFLVAVLVIWVIAKVNGVSLLAGNPSLFLSMPLALTMILSGVFVALFQLFALQDFIQNIKLKDKALWALGSSLSWGVGFILANIAWGMNFPTFSQSAIIGLVVSIITGGILQILISSTSQLETT